MANLPSKNKWILIGILAFVFILLLFPFFGMFHTEEISHSPTQQALAHKRSKEAQSLEFLHFTLRDPHQAPEEIRSTVALGYHILLHTPQYASKYTGDRLCCTHCHFAAGDTTGGKNGSIPLAGVAATYPKYNSRSKRVEDLPMRINSCFERSMNGQPLPLDSPEMIAITTYLTWISKEMPIYQHVSWLGLPRLESTHVPDATAGKHVYDVYCALCHGHEGQGEIENDIPPVWGPHSFNDGAGMNVVPTLASFIYYNMPYEDASLTVEQALDVAAFIANQSRPHFIHHSNH